MCRLLYLCANFSLRRPLCSRVRPDVRDRQTDRRQTKAPLNASALWRRGHNNNTLLLMQLLLLLLSTLFSRLILFRKLLQVVLGPQSIKHWGCYWLDALPILSPTDTQSTEERLESADI